MRILIVDDSEDWRDLTEAALVAAGYDDVCSVGSAAEAFSFLKLGNANGEVSSQADLIILDVVMPGIDGIEACAQIRRHPSHADVPIIMVTTVNDMDGLANAFVAGATDYITKPFNRVELLARARSALKIKAELDRRRARETELLASPGHANGARDRSRWIDPSTGLFLGEAAEAYLRAAAEQEQGEDISVLAIAVDRLEALRAAGGDGVSVQVLSRVANEVRKATGSVGMVAAAYWDGVIALVAPRLGAEAAREFGEKLRAAVARLAIANPESIATDAVTVSVGTITARSGAGIDAQLMAGVRSIVQGAASAGGNRVIAVDITS